MGCWGGAGGRGRRAGLGEGASGRAPVHVQLRWDRSLRRYQALAYHLAAEDARGELALFQVAAAEQGGLCGLGGEACQLTSGAYRTQQRLQQCNKSNTSNTTGPMFKSAPAIVSRSSIRSIAAISSLISNAAQSVFPSVGWRARLPLSLFSLCKKKGNANVETPPIFAPRPRLCLLCPMRLVTRSFSSQRQRRSLPR